MRAETASESPHAGFSAVHDFSLTYKMLLFVANISERERARERERERERKRYGIRTSMIGTCSQGGVRGWGRRRTRIWSKELLSESDHSGVTCSDAVAVSFEFFNGLVYDHSYLPLVRDFLGDRELQFAFSPTSSTPDLLQLVL